jgi:hypothetical protein
MILAALQFAGEVCCAQSRAADEFFPRGSLFPCAAYSVGSGPVLQANADLLRFRPSGFNLLGPQYGPTQTVLQDAKAQGLRQLCRGRRRRLPAEGLPNPIDKLAAEVTAQVKRLPRIARLRGGTLPGRNSYLARSDALPEQDNRSYPKAITASANTDVRRRTSFGTE